MRDPNNLATLPPACGSHDPVVFPSPFDDPRTGGKWGVARLVFFPTILAGIGAMSAAFAVSYLNAPPAGSAEGSFGLALFLLGITAAFIALVAILAPVPSALAVLKVHASAFLCSTVVLTTVCAIGRWSDEDALLNLFRSVLCLFLGFELVAVMYAEDRIRFEFGESLRPRFLLVGLTSAILVGWFVGAWVWSETVPARVISGAEAEAGASPYCLTANGRPVRRLTDLTGGRMQADWHKGFAGNFHAVLVIDAPIGRRYLNWSYRANGFRPLDERTVREADRDPQFRCIPAPHFARAWR